MSGGVLSCNLIDGRPQSAEKDEFAHNILNVSHNNTRFL